ncbi:hypothetical protein [Paludibacterium yongneupense]|uniref:hypothetical protein n=1 Tax=Paludibacterium yongneupense TaxID=400061 RepID=UPI0003FA4905|nr:hypothetical protein [Paludibacterium yongneupense]
MLKTKWILAACLLPSALCQAASLTVVSASIGASLAAVSGSAAGSSNSSADMIKNAGGEYKVLAVADADGRPGWVRMQLAPLTAERQKLDLYVTRYELEQVPVAAGQIVAARPQSYGLEFVGRADGRAFAVVLNDDWRKDIESHPVAI